uniref:homing endonuclease n=1 Tax=Leptographium wingfieldii TaxID=155675 RepID=UPI0023F2AE59|nr:homing endonuclease [Leptographium wingfieldii]WDZ67423.1 homing endonuclease [Leptographium wingfieldii]WDZ67470.1 homing endonuclease [Leptographium wingfieldii]WDZ67517.1 homing endonuclease [Leptographium wingfieldii]WDZ67563.1 homing endonuclease [Leptographium wingfieldii]WDZ67609.1 homing endonuclease [Leptographium wingfieldii]
MMRDVDKASKTYNFLGLLLLVFIFIFSIQKIISLSLFTNSKLGFHSSAATSEDILITPSKTILSKLNPWFITGFVDAEGSFSISVIKDPRYKAGYRVEAIFSISLHKKDLAILEQIQSFFDGAGKIKFETKREVVSYVIRSKDQIIKILLPHFDLFPLITQKRADYLLFRKAFELISNGAHLTSEGLVEILAIKSNLNLGIPSKLREEFPILPVVERPLIVDPEIPSPYWVAGFTSGEGSFYVSVSESSSTKSGSQVQLFFYITQHIRDKDLLIKLISFFGIGRYHTIKGRGWASYECNKFSDIVTKIIPFFNEYPVVGVKRQDFEDWSQIAKIVEAKGHLTTEGLAKIVKIKSGMNKGRILDNTV